MNKPKFKLASLFYLIGDVARVELASPAEGVLEPGTKYVAYLLPHKEVKYPVLYNIRALSDIIADALQVEPVKGILPEDTVTSLIAGRTESQIKISDAMSILLRKFGEFKFLGGEGIEREEFIKAIDSLRETVAPKKKQ